MLTEYSNTYHGSSKATAMSRFTNNCASTHLQNWPFEFKGYKTDNDFFVTPNLHPQNFIICDPFFPFELPALLVFVEETLRLQIERLS